MNKKKCVFAGSFDPPTLGHKAIVDDCLKIFDEVVIALLINPQKQACFSIEEKMQMLALDYTDERVKIVTFTGTLVELLKRENTPFYVRGIRNGVDLDYENANYYASKKLDENIIPVYIPCRQELLHISSSMVRNSLRFQTPIDDYVTEKIKEYIQSRK